MRNIFVPVLFFLFCNFSTAQIAQHGHAHNDYMHQRPLMEALDNGFISIEIDVFLHNNNLVVSHVGIDLDKKPTIESLYLDPIRKIIKDNGGQVYKDYKGPVIFMVELKTDAGPAYAKLNEILSKYKDMLAVYSHDSLIKAGPIQILITGHKPFAEVLKEKESYATIDGDIKDLKNSQYLHIITRYSSPWSQYFCWNGNGNMPKKEKARLDKLVAAVHKQGKQIRFYAIPDKPEVWRVLLDAHVDWVNTDSLKQYSQFYAKNYSGR